MDDLKWWQRAVFYQIYPRSFADGNGDGIGDFKGMIEHLDYLQDLGIDALWLSPHFPSPQFDCGYDVSDYTGVEPEYGTLEDFKRFLSGAHQRGIRVILDLVLNHTSHEHKWFLESRSSRDNPKRDWYIWRDGRGDEPPNNWYSSFLGSAWEYEPLTGQYYYHNFFKEQPDLNWRNPQVKRAMFDAVRFWLDLGVDGYRLDAIGTIFEHPEMPDHPVPYTLPELAMMGEAAKTSKERKEINKLWEELFQYQVQQPGMHELMQELRSVTDEYDDRLLVAEDDNIAYHGNGENELHMVFNFPLMLAKLIKPAWVRANQAKRLKGLAKISPKCWPCNTLGNHDSPRIFNRYGDGKHDAELARLNLALILTLRGTPFLYNGEEIGMTDLILQDIGQFRDLMGVRIFNMTTSQMQFPAEKAIKMAAQYTRDKNRTPLQWSNAPNAGFSPQGVQTWLPVNPNYAQGVNVADQYSDPDSMLNFYKRILRFRKSTPALIAGDYMPVHEQARDYLAFLRQSPGQTCLIVLNYSNKTHHLDFSQLGGRLGKLFSSRSCLSPNNNLQELEIAPYEILIVEVMKGNYDQGR